VLDRCSLWRGAELHEVAVEQVGSALKSGIPTDIYAGRRFALGWVKVPG
jgi:hypothetical protein